MGSSPWYQNVKFDVCPSGWLEVEVNPCPTCRHLDSDIGFDLTVFDDADFIYANRQRAGGVLPLALVRVVTGAPVLSCRSMRT